jgi:anti-sigma-K factor RskA
VHDVAANAAAYVLGALDGDEARDVDRHLRDCAPCRAVVADYRDLVAVLARGLPPLASAGIRSDALRARVLRDHRVASRRTRAVAMAGWIVAAASLALAALGSVAWWTTAAELSARRMVEHASSGAVRQRGAPQPAGDDAAVVDAMQGPEVHGVSLFPAGAGRHATPALRVYWNHTRHLYVVTAHALSRAPDGRTYQLWAIARNRAPESMGVFSVGPDGRVATVLDVPDAVRALGLVAQCALTLEPAGGSARPTETPRYLGTWRHVD